jgi:hypothetical protein
MERYCSTGQIPQRAVAPTKEEEKEEAWVYYATVIIIIRVNFKTIKRPMGYLMKLCGPRV